MITLTLSSGLLAPGDTLTVEASWSSSEERNARHLMVEVGWRLEGGQLPLPRLTDGLELEKIKKIMKRVPKGESSRSIHLFFEVPIPAQGPISYAGKFIEIAWYVVAWVDIPLALDPREFKIFRVALR